MIYCFCALVSSRFWDATPNAVDPIASSPLPQDPPQLIYSLAMGLTLQQPFYTNLDMFHHFLRQS